MDWLIAVAVVHDAAHPVAPLRRRLLEHLECIDPTVPKETPHRLPASFTATLGVMLSVLTSPSCNFSATSRTS